MPGMAGLKTSRYNFAVPLEAGALMFNAASGVTLRVAGRDGLAFACLASSAPCEFPPDCVDEVFRDQLIAGGFIVPASGSEAAAIQKRYWHARRETPMTVTIATTMDCNLGCYYCYENRSNDALSRAELPALIGWVRKRLIASKRNRLHVDWYGGEPLLNQEFFEEASHTLQGLCAELGVGYRASVISNGTTWPENVEEFVRMHRIGQVQISFDGLRANHDRRRRQRRDSPHYAPGMSPFDRSASLVDRLVRVVRVDLRLNIDAWNADDLIPFLAFCRARGWFSAPYPAVFQPARLASYSERSRFMRKCELPIEAYNALRDLACGYLNGTAKVEEAEVPDGYPYPRSSVCAALAKDSVVVGGGGQLFRCGLQVSEGHRAVGALSEARFRGIPITVAEENDGGWWERFDPCEQPTCSRCSFLPICWGGCPKKHLERDRHALEEQGAYWRKNLARLVASAAGEKLATPVEFGENDQFR